MTDQQINAAIAEACGWKEIRDNVVGKAPGETANRVFFLPNYSTSLNMMHEAEKVILPKFSNFYANKLALITGADCSDEPVFFCATARQRAEAFLRTLGKWEDEE
jgi:hypothetical protein